MDQISTIDIKSCPWCDSREEQKIVAKTYDYTYLTCSNEFTYVKCNACKCYFLKNRPSLETLNIIYPDNYSTYEYKKSLGLSYKLKNIYSIYKIIFTWYFSLKHLSNKNKSIIKIMEIGCGGGDYLSLLKKYISFLSGLEVQTTGVDFSCPKREGIDYSISGDISNLKIKENYYDLIICYQLIEHVRNPKEVLKKMINSLSFSGILIIETPFLKSVDASLIKKRFWAGWHAPRHWAFINPNEIMKYSNALGCFSKLSWTPCPYMWIESIRNLCSNKLKKFFSISNPFLVILFTIIDYLLIFIGFKTSNINIKIIKK